MKIMRTIIIIINQVPCSAIVPTHVEVAVLILRLAAD